MQLTWLDIKESVRKLCFLNTDEYDEYDPAILEAANFALLGLASRFPLLETYDISCVSSSDYGFDTYDMRSLTLNELNVPTFMGFADEYALLVNSGEGKYEPAEFTVLADRYIIVPKSFNGVIKTMYKKYPERIALLTPDNHIIEFNSQVARLMPLIMAWRIFKDDDERKAAMYYNEYIAAADETEKTRAASMPSEINVAVGISV